MTGEAGTKYTWANSGPETWQRKVSRLWTTMIDDSMNIRTNIKDEH